MQKCKNCNKTKTLKNFYLSSKYICKECLKKRTVLWQKNNPDKFKKHQAKQRAKPGYRKKQTEYYRKWYKTNGRKRSKDYSDCIKVWQKLNPEKIKMSHLIKREIEYGGLKKPQICSKCREKRRLVAHHEDYNFPFKITWLCYSCHKKLHNSKLFS